jgi:hypothetical protein
VTVQNLGFKVGKDDFLIDPFFQQDAGGVQNQHTGHKKSQQQQQPLVQGQV